jgi:hypothetical protein
MEQLTQQLVLISQSVEVRWCVCCVGLGSDGWLAQTEVQHRIAAYEQQHAEEMQQFAALYDSQIDAARMRALNESQFDVAQSVATARRRAADEMRIVRQV